MQRRTVLQYQVLVELAHATDLIAGVELDIPVSTRYEVLERLFEYFRRIGCDRSQFISFVIILVRRVLQSDL